VIGADVVIDFGQHKAIGRHDNFGDRWPGDLVVD